MNNVTLVVMAAGIGSRFGGGIKQLEPVGPNGEIIMDYSIYDALAAGFNKVVFVIRKDLEKDFDEIIGQRMKKKIQVEYAFQEVGNIPEQYKEKFKGRTKPWGTGQAILSCKGLVNEPFLVINADDYYGREAYEEAYRYLTQEHPKTPMPVCMVGFILKNTLSDNGGVTRGVCQIQDNQLIDIVETHNIEKIDGKAVVDGKEIDLDSAVSMNMWGLYPEFIDVLEQGFQTFLEETPSDNLKAEYLLPTIIGDLLHSQQAVVTALKSNDEWFGVTYKEDKDFVKENIQALVKKGMYPEVL
ncbi:sugar phosphate nucleotidyltransferase [Allocoprobacillus halotolerans]|uniref:Sugar phosphate nucleotidyltransferase n=1 Tax=Allocoprobacillus halotolerans TaxID=2944914 RepID=A0ABY5I2F1_9FIRM|nr:sugar phosphate nucleotidyltransferase [Allocoprobacillus halotolerans]UTY38162.1 sugar phosphate nucleotidyltransferase [Allocoprobacillus halotolerans]